jgi:hypothetical protein
VDETGKILGAQQRAKGTKMHPKQWHVKFATVLLPFFCFAVERRFKNKFCVPASKQKKDTILKFLLRKENVRVIYMHPSQLWTATKNPDLASRGVI